jgi:hypothetical protein
MQRRKYKRNASRQHQIHAAAFRAWSQRGISKVLYVAASGAPQGLKLAGSPKSRDVCGRNPGALANPGPRFFGGFAQKPFS